MNIEFDKKSILLLITITLIFLEVTNISNSILLEATIIFTAIGVSKLEEKKSDKIIWALASILYIAQFFVRAFITKS